MVYKFKIMDLSGHTTTERSDVDEARAEFDRIVGSGALAYRVDAPGKGTAIRKFDPGAETIVFHRALVGG